MESSDAQQPITNPGENEIQNPFSEEDVLKAAISGKVLDIPGMREEIKKRYDSLDPAKQLKRTSDLGNGELVETPDYLWVKLGAMENMLNEFKNRDGVEYKFDMDQEGKPVLTSSKIGSLMDVLK